MSEFQLGDPVQPGVSADSINGRVTRQRGLDPSQLPPPPPDPMADMPVIQGDPDTIAYRNPGNGAQRTGPDGTIYSDHVAPDGITTYADSPTVATGEANQPPRHDAFIVSDAPIARDTDAGYPGYPGVVPGIPLPPRDTFTPPAPAAAGAVAVPPAAPRNVVASDQPGSHRDPRDVSKGPQTISAEQLAAAKAAAKKAGR